jgi:hypothetical protein
MKLDFNDKYGPYYWVAHPDANPTDPVEQALCKHRYELEIIGGVEDEEADYYDDFALVEWRGAYYRFQTCGCSCPPPSETWQIDIGPASLDEIKAFLEGGHYSGYSVPKRQMGEFLKLIEEAKRDHHA